MSRECRINMLHGVSAYEQLKRKFCSSWKLACTNTNVRETLDMVLKDPSKSLVRNIVNSERKLNGIKSIEDLLEILEQRLALSEEKPHLLQCIAQYCTTPEATNAKIKDWAFGASHMVKKFMTDRKITPNPSDENKPYILKYAGVRCINPVNSSNDELRPEQEPAPQPNVLLIQEDVFMENCLRYLRSKFGTIGIRWPQFIRALPSIREGDIHKIRTKKSNGEAFLECLKQWKRISPPEERNRETLIRAAIKCNLKEIVDGLMAC